MAYLFWLCTLSLLPLILFQGWRAKRDTLRLPEAGGDTSGCWGSNLAKQAEHTPETVLVIGESTAAGVGIASHEQGIASQLALILHQATGHPIKWQTLGKNGLRLHELATLLEGNKVAAPARIYISIGVNDATKLTPLRRFEKQLHTVPHLLPQRTAPLQLIRIPPIAQFRALPAPLRYLLGWRAQLLNRKLQQLSRQHPDTFRYCDYPANNITAHLARDGFHPNAQGYQSLAEHLAKQHPLLNHNAHAHK